MVGSAGVFVIETKARTKRPGRNGKPDYRVAFDGKALHFPGHIDTRTPKQAKANARWVSGMLTKATGGSVSTQAIIALPGWMVDLKTRERDVIVLSGKQLTGFIISESAKLSEKAVQQIAYQLDLRCRDVEF